MSPAGLAPERYAADRSRHEPPFEASPWRGRTAPAAAAAAGAAGMYLVGHDGSPGWQVVRVLLVAAVTVLTLHLLRVTAGPRRAAVALAAGLVTVPVGIGVGAAHLAKDGPLAVTVAGTVALVAGLTLLVLGAAGTVSRVRGWRRIPLAVLVAVGTLLVVLPTWPALYVTNVPRPPLPDVTPADRGLRYQDVAFPASDGAQLSGWYLPSRTGTAVALLHGAGSTRAAVLPQAEVLARHGYGVLLYDARGHGGSAGRAMDFGWYGDQDVSGAVTFLAARPDVDPMRIGVVGMSMGGEQAIGAAADDPRIGAVVAEGATGRTAADQAWLSDVYGVRGSFTETWQGLLEYGLTDLLTSAAPPISLHDAAARTAPRELLLITAGNLDSERHAAHYVRSASPRTVTTWEVTGAGHTQGLATRPRAWAARVLGFLDRTLEAEG
jgi:pimeloyl-ACP methyl ester carboxylesterase